MIENENGGTVNILCEFADKRTEERYRKLGLDRLKKEMMVIALAAGIINFLFIIPDYINTGYTPSFKLILIARIIFLALTVLAAYIFGRMEKTSAIFRITTIYEVLAVFLYIYVMLLYESPDFLIQSFGAMVIVVAIFLIPNRWINMSAVSIMTCIAFFISFSVFIRGIGTSELYAVIVYFILLLGLNMVASYRIGRFKRKRFLYEEQLVKLSERDYLTGIYNREKLANETRRWAEYSKRHQTPLSVVLFDIDDFKKVNDDFGHLMGDKVLIDIAGLVKNTVRDIDVFARWGGEEFILLLPNTDKEHAVEVVERIREIIGGYTFKGGNKVTCSFGVAVLEDYDQPWEELLFKIDKLLYSAKAQGKNIIRF